MARKHPNHNETSLRRKNETSAVRHARRLRVRLQWAGVLLLCFVMLNSATAQTPEGPSSGPAPSTIPTPPEPPAAPDNVPANAAADFLSGGPEVWTSPEGMNSALQVMVMLTVLTLAPSIIIMTTSFIRIIVVLGLLRQSLGTQQLPPSQVLTALSLFITLLIMWPVWTDVYNNAIEPYTNPATEMTLEEAWDAGTQPVAKFMASQINASGNSDSVWLFYKYAPKNTSPPQTYEDVPLQVLVPAFMLSELKTAFLIGFQIYLPFVIIDIVVASIAISMGMMMLPPVLISLPFKIMLFVLVDGWRLIVGMLLDSFAPYS